MHGRYTGCLEFRMSCNRTLMADPFPPRKPSHTGSPSIVLLVVIAAFVSAVAVISGGTLAAPTIALASVDRISLTALVGYRSPLSGRIPCTWCVQPELGGASAPAKPHCTRRVGSPRSMA